MVDANEREWKKVERAIILTMYIWQHGSITFVEAQREVGGSKDQVYRILGEMVRSLPVYKDGKRWVLLGEG